MNTAILIISSVSLVVSIGTFAVVAKMAVKLKGAKDEIEAVKTKVNHNANVVKTALSALEL